MDQRLGTPDLEGAMNPLLRNMSISKRTDKFIYECRDF